MKYDSKKCNNLNFKLASGVSGFIKSAPNGDVYLYQNFCNWDPSTMTMMPVFWKTVKAEAFDAFVEDSGLSIVPRDPHTYTDWKVGDKVISNTGNKINTINAMLGKAIVLVRDAEVPITILTSADDLTKYNKLLLTDYEKELIHAQELKEKKKECPFKEGDRVLVRDDENQTWEYDVFVEYCRGSEYPYGSRDQAFKQCIPLNEHTWQLLDTTDEYKEEEYMNENLNLCEILKYCPAGTKLWSPICGDVFLDEINDGSIIPIKLTSFCPGLIELYPDGKMYDLKEAECVLFPSKEQRDWSKFEVPIKRFDPKEFKSFDKVLIRDEARFKWLPSFLGRILKGLSGKFGS